MQPNLDEPQGEAANDFHFSVGIRSPAPTLRIKFTSIIAMTIEPAQIQRGKHAHGDFERVGMFHGQVKGGETAHAYPGQNVCFSFRPDGISLLEETPYILDDVILEVAAIGIDEETAGSQQAGSAG